MIYSKRLGFSLYHSTGKSVLRTAYITHSDCLAHDTGVGHPENAERLHAINDRLVAAHLYDFMRHVDAPEVTREQLLRVHDAEYLAAVDELIPEQGYAHLDPDTVVSPDSLKAARRAAGAVIKAVDLLMNSEQQSAFCCVRPPGHHAESRRAMGFCIYNNVAVGAAHALETYGLERIAIIDFDAHQGNGTEEIFKDESRLIYCSIFQHPFYPYAQIPENSDRIVSVPLQATAKSAEFREAVTQQWIPALNRFKPEMIFISAGFDAHQNDEMSGLSLTDTDYQWVTEQLVEVADNWSSGRIVSVLEGGYELQSLARSTALHVRVLMGMG